MQLQCGLAFQAEDEDGAKLGKTLLLYQSEAWLWCTCAECIDRTAQRAWNRMAVPLDWLHLQLAVYPKHGYELIGQGIAPEFSTANEDYVYRMYRKRII